MAASLPAVGATIAWQSSVDMYQGSTSQAFVNTDGITAVAYNNTTDITSGDTVVTVNGVEFTPQNTGVALVGGTGESITINGGSDHMDAFGDGEFSSDASIFHLIRGATFNISSVTLDGLQLGQDYLIQVFTNDTRSSRSSSFITGFGDGSDTTAPVATSALNNNPPGPSVGDSIIGTFTADGTSLTFNVFGSSNGGSSWASANSQSQINAIQLRAVPEPTSSLLFGLGMLGLVSRRRR
ncbi:MAG: PEP-CTERM sorting domain-containing protein [Verrucomicrobiales bacterium]